MQAQVVQRPPACEVDRVGQLHLQVARLAALHLHFGDPALAGPRALHPLQLAAQAIQLAAQVAALAPNLQLLTLDLLDAVGERAEDADDLSGGASAQGHAPGKHLGLAAEGGQVGLLVFEYAQARGQRGVLLLEFLDAPFQFAGGLGGSFGEVFLPRVYAQQARARRAPARRPHRVGQERQRQVAKGERVQARRDGQRAAPGNARPVGEDGNGYGFAFQFIHFRTSLRTNN